MIIGKGNNSTGRLSVLLIDTVLLAVSVLLVSCTGSREAGLKRHDLFTIPIGTLPGELDWFYRDGFRMAGTADIQTRDGLVYISGGEEGKIMVFNSYGDLLTLVYNPSKIRLPPRLKTEKPFVPYPLGSCGIPATSRRLTAVFWLMTAWTRTGGLSIKI